MFNVSSEYCHLGHKTVELRYTHNLYTQTIGLSDVTTDKSKTLARRRTVLELKPAQLGATKKDFLEELLAYWGTVNDLIQRHEHGTHREGKQLVWEDARRVVFQTMVVIVEINRTL